MENTSEVAHNLTHTDLVAYHVAAYTLTMKRVDIAATLRRCGAGTIMMVRFSTYSRRPKKRHLLY